MGPNTTLFRFDVRSCCLILRSLPLTIAVHRSTTDSPSHHSSSFPFSCHHYTATHTPCTSHTTPSSSLSSCKGWDGCATRNEWTAGQGREGANKQAAPLLLHHNRPLDPPHPPHTGTSLRHNYHHVLLAASPSLSLWSCVHRGQGARGAPSRHACLASSFHPIILTLLFLSHTLLHSHSHGAHERVGRCPQDHLQRRGPRKEAGADPSLFQGDGQVLASHAEERCVGREGGGGSGGVARGGEGRIGWEVNEWRREGVDICSCGESSHAAAGGWMR